jgi:protein-tyrosine-phosphatase
MKILFVCTGNTCRSPMAAGYLRRLCDKAGFKHVQVESAGTFGREGLPPSPGAVETLNQLGIDISGHKSAALNEQKIRQADMIVTMTSTHKYQITNLVPEAKDKTRLLLEYADEPDKNVDDPIGGDQEYYQKCFKTMKNALDNLFLEIRGKKTG